MEGCTRAFALTAWMAACVLVSAQLPEDDEVMTGISGYTHPIYSGYLDVSVLQNSKAVHYVYLESQKNRATDPLILWLAGGPGCSGLLSMLQESGPFLIAPGTEKMVLNEHAWNTEAGLLYLELPAGVGFSTASTDAQVVEDEMIQEEALVALRLFLLRHSSLKKNDLYIAGSGYGATFAVKLARAILDANSDAASVYEDKILLEGLLMGNPCVSPDQCFASGSERNSFYHYEFLHKRGFIQKAAFEKLVANCAVAISPFECFKQKQQIDRYFNATNTSAYNIYARCFPSGNQSIDSIDHSCEDETGPINFLNDPDFQRNWNIRRNEGLQWRPCSKRIQNKFVGGNGTYHLLHGLLKEGLRIWVYSGDMDSTVPLGSTRKWLGAFKSQKQLPVKRNWREWWIPGRHKHEDQVGGFIWELQGLTLATVRGAGFKVAQNQPRAMYEVLQGFLTGKTLPQRSN